MSLSHADFMRLLHAARLQTTNPLFIRDGQDGYGCWQNVGSAVRGTFWMFKFPPGVRSWERAQALRLAHQRNRTDGKQVRFATLYELLMYAAENSYTGGRLFALGSVAATDSGSYRVDLFGPWLTVDLWSKPYTSDARILCVLTDQ